MQSMSNANPVLSRLIRSVRTVLFFAMFVPLRRNMRWKKGAPIEPFPIFIHFFAPIWKRLGIQHVLFIIIPSSPNSLPDADCSPDRRSQHRTIMGYHDQRAGTRPLPEKAYDRLLDGYPRLVQQCEQWLPSGGERPSL